MLLNKYGTIIKISFTNILYTEGYTNKNITKIDIHDSYTHLFLPLKLMYGNYS